MGILKTILLIIFAIDCIALILLVLMQEGKQQGLGSLGGMTDSTFWGQNKGRSMEGNLARITTFLAVLFIVLAAVLNLPVFAG
ncbi:preprotein translocase subunit SecG [Aequitasia blattaphilus]|uniref:Protein-export membrane protein SecG n=1 Tax=Aequitasia blattaphilus TaxID=2949332 RepID=A0ABT1ECI9_9FIRM|nr:preprotein translocase subunit SecG [Aequitasia blattaphilus]MCP1103553.1 preprotein translocase subunit SecG [Aequitasia blattaphilus]MCR8616193.1 preprotein translocase subunit SecG [Aequitasia blattaphilus]